MRKNDENELAKINWRPLQADVYAFVLGKWGYCFKMNGLLVPNATFSKSLLLFTLVGAMALSLWHRSGQSLRAHGRRLERPPQQGRRFRRGPFLKRARSRQSLTMRRIKPSKARWLHPLQCPRRRSSGTVQNAQALLHAIRNTSVSRASIPSDYMIPMAWKLRSRRTAIIMRCRLQRHSASTSFRPISRLAM